VASGRCGGPTQPGPPRTSSRPAPPDYPGHLEVRRARIAGELIISYCQRFLGQALNGKYIGLEAVEDGIWNIVYYTTLLGRLDERAGRVTGASYRSEKCK